MVPFYALRFASEHSNLEATRELERKFVPQWFLGSLLVTCRAAIAPFFPSVQLKSQKSLRTLARPSFLLVSKVANWRLRLACLNNRSKVLARRVSSRPMDAHFGRNTRKIHLILYNFMGKHAFWTASFQCLAKGLNRSTDLVYTLCWAVGCATEKGIAGPRDTLIGG